MVAKMSATQSTTEPTSASEREFLTKQELCQRLRKTPRCIENWMRRQYLPYIKIGHSVLFRWPDVRSALKRFQIN